MSYSPDEPFVPKQQRKQYVSAIYCDKNLEQRRYTASFVCRLVKVLEKL
jgi:hypothetical protein